MTWNSAYGEKLEWFTELEEKGETVPALEKQPDLYQDLIYFYAAWQELSGSRQMGMGLGYIGYETITDYLNEEGITSRYDRAELRFWITKIDHIFVKIENKKSKDKQNSKPKGKR